MNKQAQRGQSFVEYILIIAFIAIVVIVALVLLSPEIQKIGQRRTVTHSYSQAGVSCKATPYPEWDATWNVDGQLQIGSPNTYPPIEWDCSFLPGKYVVSNDSCHIDLGEGATIPAGKEFPVTQRVNLFVVCNPDRYFVRDALITYTGDLK